MTQARVRLAATCFFASVLFAGLALGQGTVERASVSSAGVEGDGYSYHPSISGDGRYVAFASGSSNLAGFTTSNTQIFVRD